MCFTPHSARRSRMNRPTVGVAMAASLSWSFPSAYPVRRPRVPSPGGPIPACPSGRRGTWPPMPSIADYALLADCMPFDDPLDPAREHRALLRVVEGVRGAVDVRFRVAPRFDYGEVTPWLRHHGRGVFSAIGGDDGLLCTWDPGLEPDGEGGLVAEATVRGGERVRLLLAFRRPEQLDSGAL